MALQFPQVPYEPEGTRFHAPVLVVGAALAAFDEAVTAGKDPAAARRDFELLLKGRLGLIPEATG